MKFLLVGPAWMRCKAKSEIFFDVTEIYSKPQNMDQGWKEVRNSGDNNVGCY